MLSRKRLLEIGIAFALTVAGLVVIAKSQESADGGIVISNVWARPSFGNVPNGAAYVTITNKGAEADRLLSVSGDISRDMELHEHIHEGGIMRMRRIDGGVTVAPGETRVFKPGEEHIMLIGLSGKLRPGQTFPLTLVFERAGEIAVEAKVASIVPR